MRLEPIDNEAGGGKSLPRRWRGGIACFENSCWFKLICCHTSTPTAERVEDDATNKKNPKKMRSACHERGGVGRARGGERRRGDTLGGKAGLVGEYFRWD